MSQMEVDSEPSLALSQLRDEADPELSTFFYSLEDLYERKLWYQLTSLLSTEFYSHPSSKGLRLRLYDEFIVTFYDKINQLKLIEFLLFGLEDIADDYSKHLEYFESLKTKITEHGKKLLKNKEDEDKFPDEIVQALIFVDSETARIKLQLGLVDEASSTISDCEKRIDNLNSVDGKINASFYKTSGQLSKAKKDFNAYYYNSLLYLACLDKEFNLLSTEQLELIVNDTCYAALLGDKVYNFGEILMHDIFEYCKINWLRNILISLSNGDLESFNKIINSKEFQTTKVYTEILDKVDFLKHKVCIMAFIELIFEKPVNGKILSFQEILDKISLLSSIDEVEHLIMKSLSLGLIKGHINEVNKFVEVNWSQPRTMTKDQITSMKDKLISWSTNVNELSEYMDAAGKELWV